MIINLNVPKSQYYWDIEDIEIAPTVEYCISMKFIHEDESKYGLTLTNVEARKLIEALKAQVAAVELQEIWDNA